MGPLILFQKTIEQCFLFLNWRMLTLQYCDGFCHTSTWMSHRCTCVPPAWTPAPTFLPTPSLWVVPEHQLWVSCFMHQTCAGHLFYIWQYTCFNAILSNHPTLTFSHKVQKSVLHICVSFAALYIGLSLPSFQTRYICINILYWCFSFWLTSLCITHSRFIHLIRTDSNVFFL